MQKEGVFMPKLLLGETHGNQIGKHAMFHIKKVLFYKAQGLAVSALEHGPKNSLNFVKKRAKFNIFGEIHSLK